MVTVDWRTYTDRRLDDSVAAHIQVHRAEEVARTLAKGEMDRRLAEANNLREQFRGLLSKDEYQIRHGDLTGQMQRLVDRMVTLERTGATRTDEDALATRVTLLERGNAVLLARYAVLGTIAIIVFGSVMGLLLHLFAG